METYFCLHSISCDITDFFLKWIDPQNFHRSFNLKFDQLMKIKASRLLPMSVDLHLYVYCVFAVLLFCFYLSTTLYVLIVAIKW